MYFITCSLALCFCPGWSPRPKTGMGRTRVADKGFRQNKAEFRYGPDRTHLGHPGWDRTDPRPTLGHTKPTQEQPWARQKGLRTWSRPNKPKAYTGPDRTDPRPTLGQTEKTQYWARPNKPKANTGPVRTDPRPILGQNEKTQYLGQIELTQDQPWARPKRLSTWARPNRPRANTEPDRTDPRTGTE